MKLDELVLALIVKLELMDPVLIQRARLSWNLEHGLLDGRVVRLLLDHISSILPSISDDLKRDGYNEIADSDELDKLDESATDIDFRIRDALLTPLIDRLISEEVENIFSKSLTLHP